MTSKESGSPDPGASSDPQELLETLGDEFTIIRKLGQGAMGSVFLARDTAMRRLVAIKVPKAQLARDEVVRRRFQREAEAAGRLVHPSVATTYRIGSLPGDVPFIVMEYVEGRTLGQTLEADGPFPIDQAVGLLEQIASALAAAHKEGVIHRDVRPGNVLFEAETGRAVLTDFGIAGILETGTESITRLTQAGQILGDPAHTSPEQLQGEEVTEATDVYSLGVLGYELLTAERPYTANTRAQLITAHLRQSPRDLSSILPGVDPRLQALLEKCLSKTPEHRPSASRVRDTLAAIASGPESTEVAAPRRGVAEHVPAFGAFLKEIQRRRVGRVGVTYVAVAVVALTAGEMANEAFDFVERIYPAMWAIAVGGFPVALSLAWIFDLDASGIRRTEPKSPGSGSGVQILKFVSLALSVGLAVLLWIWFTGGGTSAS